MKTLLICIMCWSVQYIACTQSLSELALEAGRNRDFKKAIPLFKEALQQAKLVENSSEAFSIYEKLQECYISQFQLDSAIIYFEDAEQYAKSHKNIERYFDFKMGKAEIYQIQGDLVKSFPVYKEILASENLPTYHRIRTHLRLAGVYNARADSTNSYQHIQAALDLAIAEKDSSILGGIYESYASIESEYGSAFKAVDLFQKSIPFFENQNQVFRLGSVNRRISYIFQRLGNLDKANEFCHESLEISTAHNHKGDMARARSLLGEIYLERQIYDTARIHFLHALEYYNNKHILDQISNLNTHLADVEMGIDRPQFALAHLLEARSGFNQNTKINTKVHYYLVKAEYELKYNKDNTRIRMTIDSCRLLTELSDNEYIHQQLLNIEIKYLKKAGLYKEALIQKEAYDAISEKIRKRNQSQLVHDLEAKYQNQILDKEVEQLNTANLLYEAKLRQQTTIIIGVSVALLLLTLLGYFLYRLYRQIGSQKSIIERTLAEKELLLKEIHHRVKNNLQVISSLLSLQSGYVHDDKAIEALKHGQDRVQSMALIHKDLYQTDNLNGVNTRNYFEGLIDNLLESYHVDEGDIDIKLDVDSIMLDIDTMIPLGLVVNELISNVFKHAFVGRNHGKVNVVLKENENTLILSIKDNGVGLKTLDELSGDTFGFQMIQAFAGKLKADMEVNQEDGLEIKFRIKNYSKAS